MEDKENTESGSPSGNSEFDSLPSIENGGAYGVDGGGGAAVAMLKNGGAANSAAVAVGGEINGTTQSMGGGIVGSGGISAGGGGIASIELTVGKKKRGRPRKYDADGNLTPGYVKSAMKSPPAAAAQPCFTLSAPPSYGYTAGAKRGRGRSAGSSGSLKNLASLGELFLQTAGGDFTPHVVTAYTGEDIAGKILTFAQKGSRGVCVLSANGSVSNVTVRQPGSSGGLMTYEGRFEILSLVGSYTICEKGGFRSRNGGLSVSLASSDGRVIGGCVAGFLMAATPIQIVVGSFEPNGFKTQKRKQRSEGRRASSGFSPATVTAAIPLSQAAPAIQLLADQSNKDHPSSASTDTSDWNDSGPVSDQRPSPDMNISIPLDHH